MNDIQSLLKEMKTDENKKKIKQSRQDERVVEKMATLYDTHNFWDSQPVPKKSDKVDKDAYDKPIDVEKKVDDISADPLPLPAGFNWVNVNIEDDNECQDVYELLT